MNKKTIIEIFGIVILGIVVTLIILNINGGYSKDRLNEKTPDEIIDVSQINDWKGLNDLYQEKSFQSLNDEQKCDLIDEIITNIKETYRFDSYEYNIKQDPLVIALYFSDGYKEAIQIGEFDPKMN